MIDERDLLERAAERFTPPVDAFERFTDRRERHRRNQRIAASGVAIVVMLAAAIGFAWASRSPQQDTPAQPNLFSSVQGWIAIGGPSVTAIDPSDPTRSVVLSSQPGDAYVWSNDGTHLLVARHLDTGSDLFVLDADGRAVRVARDSESASFSPDGRTVIYGGLRDLTLYDVPADGGDPRVMVAGTPTDGFAYPLASPDGAAVVYAEVADGKDGGLWVMGPEGDARREIAGLDALSELNGGPIKAVYPMAWSPDGHSIAFGGTSDGGVADAIFAIGSDGSDLRLLTPHDSGQWWSAGWSPDSSQIALLSARRGLILMDGHGSGSRILLNDPPGDFMAWNPVAP